MDKEGTTENKKKPFFTHRFQAVICQRRVKCCGCNRSKIEKGEVKIQKAQYNGWVGKWDWLNYHMLCIFAGFHPKLKVVIHSEDDIGGFSGLEPKYQGYIRDLIKTYKPKYTSDKNTPAQAKESKEKKGESSSSAAASDMPKKGSAKQGRKKKAEVEDEAIPSKKGKKSTEQAANKLAEPTKKKAELAKNKAEPAKKKAEPAKKKAEPKPTPAPKKAKKRVRVIESSESSSEEEEDEAIPSKKGKKSTEQAANKLAEPTKKKAEPAKKKAEPKPTPAPKKVKKRVRVIESSESSSEEEEELVSAAPAKKVTSATKTDNKTLSDDAKQAFWDLHCQVQSGDKLTVEDFSQFTVNELKLAIKLNDRSTTGNKTDLAKNLVDYMTNGCPPRCPTCGGGRLKTRKAGGKTEYYCPGYMEDDEFVNCAYTVDWIARIPWKSP